MISNASFSELLATLHAAPLEEANFQRFLTLLCETTQTTSGVMISHDQRSNRTQMLAGDGLEFSPEWQHLYNTHYAAFDPYPEPFNRNPRVGVIAGDELVPRGQFKKSEFFNDLLARFNMHHSTLTPFVSTAARIECITLWRGAEQGVLSRDSETLLDLLIPHLRSAIALSHALETAGERALLAEVALDAIPTAAFLLNEKGCLLHMNKAAESLVSRQDGIHIHRNRLAASDLRLQRRLEALVAFAAAASGAAAIEPGGAIKLGRTSSDRPLHALIAPLRLSNQQQCSPAHVLVLVTDPDAPPVVPQETLSVLYGLTSSEAAVANGLLAGLSPEQISELRHVSLGTTRTQLKSSLHKTGARRQSDLIRLLLSLPKTASREE